MYIIVWPFCSARMCSPAIFETFFSYDKAIWIAATDYYMLFYIIVLFLSYSPINKFYSFIFFCLLINAVILLLNYLVLVLYLYCICICLYSAQYLRVLHNSKRCMTRPTVQVQSNSQINTFSFS